MIKVLFLIIMCKNVIGNIEESNEKYIDLLPDEEKQEFLNRIARRILEEIKSKDTPNESHADITDDQLNAHDAFVQEILKEESDNFKNEKKQLESKEGNENDQIETNDNTPNEHDRIDSNNGDKVDHIDLTLREGRRQKRKNSDPEFGKETTTEMSYDVIPVKTIYDQFENDDNKVEVLQVDNSTNKGEGNISTLEKEEDTNVNDEGNVNIISDIRNSSGSILTNDVLINDGSDKNENIKDLRKSFHNEFKLGTTEMVEFEPNSYENSPTTSNIDDEETTPLPTQVSEEVTESTLNDENIWVSTQKIYDEENEKTREEQEKETTTVYKTTSDVFTDTITETMTITPTDSIETSKNKSTDTEISNVTNSDSHISKDKVLRGDSNEYKDMKTERSVIEVVKLAAESHIESESITLTTIGNTSLSQLGNEVTTENQLETSAINNLSVAESSSIKNINFEISTNIENGDKENLGVTESGNVLKSEVREDVKYVEQNTKIEKRKNNDTILRTAIDSINVPQIDENEYVKTFGDDSSKVKVYEVFEVDKDEPHFIAAGKVHQNEHPLYVPVYNYAPDNVYYRPYNKYGPNIEDQNVADPKSFKIEDSEPFNLQNARNSFSGYNNNKKRNSYDKNKRNITKTRLKQVTKKQKSKNNFLNQVTQNVHHQAIYYNPDDYADLDYYYGRILRRGQKHNSVNKNNEKKYFPDSNEYDHPLSIMHKSDTIKDHISAVRNILYLQKLFGYVPQGNEKSFGKTQQYFRTDESRKHRKQYNISADYYFDRADEVDHNKEVFRLHKSKFNSNSNIVPLTPKPFNFEPDLENIHEKQKVQIDNDHESINREINNVPFKKLFEAMIVVLKDAIEVKNENLVKYDWLKTTVNIQAAMRKLLDLIKQLKSGEYVHPKDIELLKYTIYLFKSSNPTKEEASIKENVKIIKDTKTLRAKKIKIKIKIPIHLRKKSASLRRRKGVELKEHAFNLLSDFENMLHEFLFYLNDLHDTIKHISIITEYKNQNWLEDLKVLYLEKGSKKNLAKVILHLSLSRLLDSIEDSSTHGVEDDFRIFVKKNRETVKKSREESLFVLNVLEELSRLH